MSSRAASKAAARERIAATRAAEARAARRRRVLLATGGIGLVLVLVLALVVARAAGLGSGDDATTTAGAGGGGAAAPGVVRAVTSVPDATLDEVGAGTAQGVPQSIKAPALTDGGKPKVLYVGAEFCPFCAAQRWPVVVALSRFGTWSHLGATASASNDVHPNTATLSFHGATYSSDHLAFTGVETRSNKPADGGYAPLDQLGAVDQKTFDTYNRPPYVEAAGSIPFLDIAGRYVASGASVAPELLAGKSRAQIAAALADPGDPIAKAVDGSANVLTAALCEVTGQQPTDVCSSAGVTAAATALTQGQS